MSPPDRYPRLAKSLNVDLVVVGGGITGLSVTLGLRALGFTGHIVLTEKNTIGSGATGRSGGILFADDEYLPGSVAGLRTLRKWLNELDLDHLIEVSQGQLAGIDGEYDVCTVNPQRLVNELARQAIARKVEIYQHSELRSFREQNHSLLLSIGGAQVVSRFLFFASGAYTSPSLLERRDLIVSEEDCIVLESRESKLPWTYCRLVGAEQDFVWGRRIGQRQFLFGGGNKYSLPNAMRSERLNHALDGLRWCLPELSKGKVITHWIGLLSRFEDGATWKVAQVDGYDRVYFADGFDGQGLIAGASAGFEAAQKLIRRL